MNNLPRIAILLLNAVHILISCTEPTPTCSGLTSINLRDVDILSAEEVGPSDIGPAHCKVLGMTGADIKFELLLPHDWKGKFVMGGGGGFVGSIRNHCFDPMYDHGGNPLKRGYATVGTDTGHTGKSSADASWAHDNLERKLNYGYRAVHLVAAASKDVIHHYYDRKIEYSYFMGCSNGGRQGMLESQLYPVDFDGIVAGAPAFDFRGLLASYIPIQKTMYPDQQTGPIITAANVKWLESEILERCDVLDGVPDGVLEDPRTCTFSLSSLPACTAASPGPGCFTADQQAALEAIYGGLKIEGQQLYPGFPFGAENAEGGWDEWIMGSEDAYAPGIHNSQLALMIDGFRYLILDDPDWDYSKYDFSNYLKDSSFSMSFLNATDTNLADFNAAGGKMILWHGWADPAISALSTIEYYEAVEAQDPESRDYVRLFMVPGVLHCDEGPGPNRIDWLTAIEQWVEHGIAPERLVASRIDENGTVERTRPLCPYPQVAVYSGTGSINDAANFSCKELQ